jgi:hypothetical protein
MIEVRAMTVRSRSRDSLEISSSVMPSEKYSFSASALIFVNGSTAMRFLSKGACSAPPVASEVATRAGACCGAGVV